MSLTCGGSLRAFDYRCVIFNLWEAHVAAAKALPQQRLDYACQFISLHASGVTETALRTLVEGGYVSHLMETTSPQARHRTYKPACNLRLSVDSAFLLTPAGVELAHRLLATTAFAAGYSDAPRDTRRHPSLTPHWNQDEKILYVDGTVVKYFKVPADTQELILEAFEEEGWPSHLDDPLPPQAGNDSKQRLHDAIKRLNRQKTKLIQFAGDGRGRGIRWRLHPL